MGYNDSYVIIFFGRNFPVIISKCKSYNYFTKEKEKEKTKGRPFNLYPRLYTIINIAGSNPTLN